MRRLRALVGTAALLSVVCGPVAAGTSDAQTVTIGNFDYIRDIAASINRVYFATTEGITVYNTHERRWEMPLTSSPDIDHLDIRRIDADLYDEQIYIQTSIDYFEYDRFFDDWFRVSEIPEFERGYRSDQLSPIMYAPSGWNYVADGFLIDVQGREYGLGPTIDDGAGNLWLGVWGRGAATSWGRSGLIELLPYGVLSGRVDAVRQDGDQLWIGGQVSGASRAGISIYEPDENKFTYIEAGARPDFPLVDIYCFDVDSANVYIGTGDGVYRFERETEQIYRVVTRQMLVDPLVRALAVVDQNLFVGTSQGLALVDLAGDSLRMVRPGQFANEIVYDFETTDSAIWLATSAGAFQLKFETGALQRFRDPDQVVFGRAYDIARSGNTLWISSDNGVTHFDLASGETGSFASAARVVRRRPVAVTDGAVALATDFGLTLYFTGNNAVVSEREFTTADGLPSTYINCLLFDGDFLWIGSDRGLTQFLWNDPDRID